MANITEELAKKVTQPQTGQRLIFDDRLTGFGVRLTPGSRSWIVQLRENRRSRRITIGTVGIMPLADAKKKASALKLEGVKAKGDNRPKTVAELWARLETDDARRLRASTKRVYGGYWRTWIAPVIGAMAIGKVKPADVSTLLNAIPGAVNANRVFEVVKRMFAFAVDHDWVAKNPASAWKRRHEIARENYLSIDELQRLFDALPDNEVGDALRFASLTGARIGEVFQMRHQDLRENGRLWLKPATTTKQKKAHLLPLSAGARALVDKHIRHSSEGGMTGLVFARDDGRAILNARKTFQFALRRADLPTTTRIHDLRHSLASLLINDGQSLALVGAALGHASAETTKRYAHLHTQTLADALERASNVIPIEKARKAERKSA